MKKSIIIIIAIALFSCAKEEIKTIESPKLNIAIENTGDGLTGLLRHNGVNHRFVTAYTDTFEIIKFKYYISNLMLVNTISGEFYKVPNSYYLFGYENGKEIKPETGVTIEKLPIGKFTHLTFGIGVDNSANLNTAKQGELDPSSEMAWNWNTGYKFVVLEGNYLYSGTNSGIVFHIGTNTNYKSVTLSLPSELSLENDKNASIKLKADVSKMFSGVSPITRTGTPTVPGTIMGGANATSVAGNYAIGMFSVTEVTN
jgi:hypothetical protein